MPGGKLAELPDHRSSAYLTVDEFLELKMDAGRDILDAKFISDDILLVQHKPRAETIRSNRFASIPHAIMITSYSR